MNVRTPSESEWVQLRDLERECFGEGAFSVPLLRMVPLLFAGTCPVAEVKGRIVGYALGVLAQGERETGWILAVAVHPDARGRGLGRALTERCTDLLGDAGARRVKLTVAPDNEAALAMYRGLGFGEEAFVEGFYGPGEDRLVLTRELTSVPRPRATR